MTKRQRGNLIINGPAKRITDDDNNDYEIENNYKRMKLNEIKNKEEKRIYSLKNSEKLNNNYSLNPIFNNSVITHKDESNNSRNSDILSKRESSDSSIHEIDKEDNSFEITKAEINKNNEKENIFIDPNIKEIKNEKVYIEEPKINEIDETVQDNTEIIVVNNITYAKLCFIGKGGSSKVYKVLSPNFEVCALKKVKLPKMDKKHLDPYLNEIELMNKFKGSKYIIQMYDYEINKAKKVIYIVMEYGEIDLKHRLNDLRVSNMLSSNYLRFCWEELLNCVAVIHNAMIIHSDLKPANFIFVHGQLKLIDFGISKEIVNSQTTNIISEDHIGTINYMSPESFNNISSDSTIKVKIGRSRDIYALGCIFYEMIYGKPPLSDYNLVDKIKILSDSSLSIAKFPQNEKINGVIKDVILKCLERDPRKRPTIQDLLQHPYLNPQVITSQQIDMFLSLVIKYKDEERLKNKGFVQKLSTV